MSEPRGDSQSKQRAEKPDPWSMVQGDALLAAIVASSDDAIISKDLNGVIRSWNRGAETIFGYAAEEAIGRSIKILAVPERANEMEDILARVKRGEQVEHYETKRRTKDRRVLTISLTVSPVRNAAGEIVGASKIARDITERKLAEERLRESEARFRGAVNAVSSLIWTNNAHGQMTGEQLGWCAFTGQTYDDYQGYGWASAVHPDDAQGTIDAWNEAVADRRMFVFEHRVRRFDGVYRLFAIRAVPVLDQNGEIREWVGVHTDVTEERRLTEERAQALAREHRARETAEILDRVGRVLSTELDPQVLTQTITDLATQLVGADFGSLFHNVTDEYGESYFLYTISGAPKEAFANFPMPRNTKVFAPTSAGETIVRSDDITQDSRYGQNAPYFGMPKGHLPVRSYLAAPVVSRSGIVLGGLFFGHHLVGVFTEQHEELLAGIAAQAASALDNAHLFADSRKIQEKLQRANADLEQFAYSASHDLREPLRTVTALNQMLKKKYSAQLGNEGNEILSLSIDAAQRMDELLTGLRAYTHAAISDDPDMPPVAGTKVFEQAAANLGNLIAESGAEIECGPLPYLRVQEVFLLQLFQNLLSNALKYRTEEPPRIRLHAEYVGGFWKFSIRDNGIGIDAGYTEQVFGLFSRLHSAEKYSGSGIGLALCQKIVQRYNGKMWVESEGRSKGSTFFFTLPGTPQLDKVATSSEMVSN
jgi:PAS domain S-box-containing protein